MKDSYPEHEKLKAVQSESQKLGAFLEELETRGIELCTRLKGGPHEGEFVPVSKSINEVLADYFEIDLKKIEEEKRAMLEAMRSLNKADQEWSDETPPEMQ